jgi:hypothetical protein
LREPLASEGLRGGVFIKKQYRLKPEFVSDLLFVDVSKKTERDIK